METFEIYLDAIKKHEPGMVPYANNGFEEYRYHVFLNEQDWSRPLDHANSNTIYRDISFQPPDWEVGIFSSDLSSGMTERIPVTNDGMAVGAYSKHPERALMFLELCYQDQEIYDIVQNGIEGVTYEKDDETMTKWTPEGADPSEIALKNLGMGIRAEKFDLDFRGDSPLVKKLEEQYAEAAVLPGLSGYAVKQDTIAAELAALKFVSDEYKVPLEKGVTDPEETLNILKQKLKDAGADRVMEEINSQIAAYLSE